MANNGLFSSFFSMSDEQAMWRVKMQNDHHAFAQLVHRWEAPILRLCARMTGDMERSEDLKQEAFARVYTRRAGYKTDMRFSTWLWRITLNLCYDELRKTKRYATGTRDDVAADNFDPLNEVPAEEGGPDAQVAAQEESELVRRTLLRLPEMLQTVLVLRFCEGLKLREIAEILEIPESTVRYRVAEGLSAMTRMLEPELRKGRAGGQIFNEFKDK